MIVRLPENRVVRIYLVNLQYFRLSQVQAFTVNLNASPRPIGSLQLVKQTKWLLLNYLALKLVYEFSERTELF